MKPSDKDKEKISDLLGDELIKPLLDAVLPEPLSLERRLALRARISDRRLAVRSRMLNESHEKTKLITVRSVEGEWETIAPGVRRKLLHRSGVIQSYLFRLVPGAIIPAHNHDVDEECLLLEGDAALGGIDAVPGDYQIAPKGSRHEPISTRGGALLFVRYGNALERGNISQ